MADDWEDEFAVTGNKTKSPTATKHGSPVPLKTDNWEDEFAVTGKRDEQQKNTKAQTPGPMAGTKTDKILTSIFGPINKAMRSLPLGLDTMEKEINPSLVKGIPVAGQMVPQTEELTQFEENNPGVSTAFRATGAIGSTLPMAAGVAARSAAGVLPQAFNQGMLGTTLGVGDTIAAKGTELEKGDIEGAAGAGFAGGMGGSLLGRMITPTVPSRAVLGKVGGLGKREPNLSRADREFMAHRADPSVERSRQMLEAAMKKQPAAPVSPTPRKTGAEQFTSGLLRAGIGGALSHTMGMGPIPGMAIGAVSPFVPGMAEKGAKAWYRNQLLNNPRGGLHFAGKYFQSDKQSQIPRYILNALMMQAGQE